MRFCYPWRTYQAEVLAALDSHLDDRKLHVAAAPGAGKTVLGLEVMRRIGKPALILAPSLAIRNQWVDRLVDLFLPDRERPGWVSTDLRDPKPVTVATYQALHTDCAPEDLVSCGIETVLLDEAHHLRKSWWETLDRTVTALAAQTVSLTATPPYDVSSQEWQRYHALCGPLDAEISIPELVKSGDLAPHQDLVYHAQLLDAKEYLSFEKRNADLRDGLRANEALCALLQAHPWLTDTERQPNQILSDPELFSAMLVYLSDAGRDVPPYALRLLGVGKAKIPTLTDRWLEILCQGLLPELPECLTAHLTKHGALARGRVSVPPRTEEARERILRDAPEKFQCIRDIVRAERAQMGDRLRLAILSEHVGANAVALAAQEPDFFCPDCFERQVTKNPRVGRLTAGSVFERLRLEPGQKGDLAVLTGSLCIVPCGSLKGDGIAAAPLPHDPRYDRVTLSGAAVNRRVRLISDLVADGTVRVLIGTRALLGQGWDAPTINTLILATNVKSFVSSNQLRGRAIRRDPQAPDKAANIWHIATVAPSEPGPEMDALKRRFDTFVHLDPDAGKIRSGFAAFADLETINARSMARASERNALAQQWQKALVTGRPNPHIQRRVETMQDIRGLVRTDVAAQAIPRLAIAGGAMVGWATVLGDPLTGAIAFSGSAIVLAPAAKRLKRLVDHGTLAGSLRQVGYALLHGMRAAGLLRTDRAALTITAGSTSHGNAFCALEGATLPEETRFLALLEEFFSPIENPRYLLIRESYLGRRLQVAPYPVPAELGRKKDLARALQDGWHRYVGPAKLVYTRTVAGRMALLQARTVTLAEAREVRRSSVWE